MGVAAETEVMMDVTVVLTTVGGPWLTGQLDALSRQTRPAEQIVLVNNGPRHAVDAVAAIWKPFLPQLEILDDDRTASCAFARNVGAAHARHRGLLFLDDDDEVAPGYVAAMSAALDRADLVAARVDLTVLNAPRLLRHWGAMQSAEPMRHHGFLPWVVGGALGVRRVLFDRLQGFDTAWAVAEDTDLSWRAQLHESAVIEFAPDAVVCYRLRGRAIAAFRQARTWARWEHVLRLAYEEFGLAPLPRATTSWRRWGRPFLVAATARSSDDFVVAARLLGACWGRADGSRRGAVGLSGIRPRAGRPGVVR
jgi:glycosyltransferase involved in cell wall biosynthesis